jgi:drug/metabolite transporter (DMT)-like permease
MRRERVLTILSFLAIHFVWGSTYLAIRYSIQTIPPLVTAGLRHVIGGSALFAWCWWRGYRPTLQQWRASAVLGVLFFLIGHGTLHWAELIVPSGVAALLIASEPVWIAALSAVTSDRLRLNVSGIAGLVIGIAAVAVLVGRPSTSFDSRLTLASLAVVGSALAWSLGIIYSRTAPLHPMPIMSASMSLLCGGVMLIGASFITGTYHIAQVSLVSAAALAYLVIFGALTFAAYTWLLTKWPPVLVATHAYTNPLIAVLLGAVIGGEHVTLRIVIAALAIVVSILLVRHDTAPSPRLRGEGGRRPDEGLNGQPSPGLRPPSPAGAGEGT